jgi:hypothetical protein
MKLSFRLAGCAILAAASAAAAAAVTSVAVGSPHSGAAPTVRPAPDAQAAAIVYRYLAALRAHDWPAACTLVEAQLPCLEELADTKATFGTFSVVAATARNGRAVASVTVDGVPCRVTLVQLRNQWLIRDVEISSGASASRAPAGSTALDA